MASGYFRTTSILNDAAVAWKFLVELDGVEVGLFTECEGLKLERDVVDQKEGGNNDFIHKFPGRIKQDNIRLRRAIMFAPELWTWFNTGVVMGRASRRHVTIHVQGPDGLDMQVWDVINAWPVKYEGPELKVDSVQAAAELIEMAHHGLKMHRPVRPNPPPVKPPLPPVLPPLPPEVGR